MLKSTFLFLLAFAFTLARQTDRRQTEAPRCCSSPDLACVRVSFLSVPFILTGAIISLPPEDHSLSPCNSPASSRLRHLSVFLSCSISYHRFSTIRDRELTPFLFLYFTGLPTIVGHSYCNPLQYVRLILGLGAQGTRRKCMWCLYIFNLFEREKRDTALGMAKSKETKDKGPKEGKAGGGGRKRGRHQGRPGGCRSRWSGQWQFSSIHVPTPAPGPHPPSEACAPSFCAQICPASPIRHAAVRNTLPKDAMEGAFLP